MHQSHQMKRQLHLISQHKEVSWRTAQPNSRYSFLLTSGCVDTASCNVAQHTSKISSRCVMIASELQSFGSCSRSMIGFFWQRSGPLLIKPLVCSCCMTVKVFVFMKRDVTLTFMSGLILAEVTEDELGLMCHNLWTTFQQRPIIPECHSYSQTRN